MSSNNSSGLAQDVVLKRTAINNSLLDLVVETSSSSHGGYHPAQDRPLRRGSVGSLGKYPSTGEVLRIMLGKVN